MKIRPLYDRVVVKRREEEAVSAGGIVLPGSAKEKPTQGEVLAVGTGKVLDNGDVRPMSVKVGDRVLFGQYSGNAVKIDGDEVVILNESELYGVIDAWTAANDEATVLATAAAAGVPASRVFSVADMFADPQYLAREMIREARLPDGKIVRVPGIVPRLSATPGDVGEVGPALGEHTEEILSGLGYSVEAIELLRSGNAI